MFFIITHYNKVKPLNSGYSQSPKFCPLFSGDTFEIYLYNNVVYM